MINLEEIQPGWSVVDAHGDDVGTVVDNSGSTLRVRTNGFLGGEITVSREDVSEFETGRVELKRTRQELAAARA